MHRFPNGAVFESNDNLGIAMNFDRAERYVFEILSADAAIFFEDDMIISPVYLEVLGRLIERALEDERIGYVAAFGNFAAPR